MQTLLRLLACALCLLPAMAGAITPAEQAAFERGFAQAVLEREFSALSLIARNGSKPGDIVVNSTQCLNGEQKAAITKALLGKMILNVIWDLACPDKAKPPVDAKPAEEETKMDTVKEKLKEVEVEALPTDKVFRPLLADPREPRFSLNWQRHKTENNNFDAADVSIGEYFGLAEGKYRGGVYQVGIQAAVFALFNLDSKSFDLINADYLIGFPVTWRRDAWSARVRLYHLSSHLGDEFLLGNPGVDRINLSYEVMDGLVSYDWARMRLYGGGGVLLHSKPDLKQGATQFGAEYQVGSIFGNVDLTVGADFKSTAEQDWRTNQSYRAGFTVVRGEREVKLLLQHYRGFSPNGQFFSDRLEYNGIGVYLGF